MPHTSIVTSGWYREETLRSGCLYQIYAYLRSQVGRGDSLADRASGLLLHLSVGQAVDEMVVIQGHGIRFATVDLIASVGWDPIVIVAFVRANASLGWFTTTAHICLSRRHCPSVQVFLAKALKVDSEAANLLLMSWLLTSVPIFIGPGALSDCIGRKPFIVGGCLIAAPSFLSLFGVMTFNVNPALAQVE